MVSADLGPRDDRGQLILIGAIAIALIIVGVVLVVNTALFTEVVGSEGTVETAKESGVSAEEQTDAVSAVVHQANLQPSHTSDSDVDSDINGELNRLFLNNSLDGRGAFTALGYNGRDDSGTAILQQSDNSFGTSLGGTWEPVPSGSRGDVGHFVLVIDVSASSGTTEIEVDDGSDTRTLEIDASASDELTLTRGSNVCTVSETSGTVRIDAYHGVVYESSCQFDLFDGLNPGYSVEITGGDTLTGQYEIVTDGVLSPSVRPCSDSEIDCFRAIWTYDLEYTYDTGDVVTEGQREVAVYD